VSGSDDGIGDQDLRSLGRQKTQNAERCGCLYWKFVRKVGDCASNGGRIVGNGGVLGVFWGSDAGIGDQDPSCFFLFSLFLSPLFPIIFRSCMTFFSPVSLSIHLFFFSPFIYPSFSFFALYTHLLFFFFFFFSTLMFVFFNFFLSFNSGISRSFSNPLRPNPPPFPNKILFPCPQSASPGCPGRPSGCTCRRRCGPRLRSWGARTRVNRRC
jgi:hypothetical protein